jgi:hypothetical protein
MQDAIGGTGIAPAGSCPSPVVLEVVGVEVPPIGPAGGTPIPEPSAALFFAAGALAMGLHVRRVWHAPGSPSNTQKIADTGRFQVA